MRNFISAVKERFSKLDVTVIVTSVAMTLLSILVLLGGIAVRLLFLRKNMTVL